MNISEKLDMLGLSPAERKKAQEKFLATLALISVEELKEVLEFLASHGIYIKNAREIKVLANSKEEISKKYNILEEVKEVGLYKNDPAKINYNVIDVYKKIQYCKQMNIPYKKEDGTYEKFLFNEGLWQEVVAKEASLIVSTPVTPVVEEEIISVDPIVSTPVEPVKEEADDKYMDIQEYIASSLEEEPVEEKTTTFDVITSELEEQELRKNVEQLISSKESLQDFKRELENMYADEISFDDLSDADFTEGFGGR